MSSSEQTVGETPAGGQTRVARRPTRRGVEALRVVCLVALCTLFWSCVYNRLSLESWQIPVDYGDGHYTADMKGMFAYVKAASEGRIWPLLPKTIPELGAPFGANWSDYPSGDEMLADLGGLLMRAVGLFAAVNLLTLLAHVLAALAFYAACRAAACHWGWSFAGALVFAFSTFAFAQGSHHLTVLYYWHVPLCLLVCRWISRPEGLGWRNWRFRWALAVAVITGVQNVYYANMFVQLALLGVFFQLLRRGWRPALPAVAVAAATCLAFLLMRTDNLVCRLRQGPNTGAVTRHFEWVEYYALKICDLFIPPPVHPFSPFAAFSRQYFSHVLVPGEAPPGSYLGIVGIAALACFVAVCVRRVLRKPSRGLPLEGWQLLWILVYSTVGGLNGLAASFGFLLFRSTTRYSIFILALLLFFAVRQLSAWDRLHRARNLSFAAATCLALLALWDQAPRWRTDMENGNTAWAVSSDRAFTQKMEARLPPGAMVFQLPIMEFPESPEDGVAAYDHFRPYLYSTHLRYSFGAVKGRPVSEWQQPLDDSSEKDLIPVLERLGFAALYVNRSGYDDRGAEFLQACREDGRTEVINSAGGDLFCVLLKPSPHPVSPGL